jgi:cadmium resistance protein CadD (predicted permease)
MPDALNGSLGSAVAIALVVYASTNVDDLLVLAVFFADPRARVSAVVAGRYVGLAALIIGSTAAALLALAVPDEWVALLGLVPLFLGLRLLALLRHQHDADTPADVTTTAVASTPRHGFMAQALTVAGVTLANGGDNFGVYIPFFATAPGAIPIYVSVFIVMTAVWCALGYVVVNNPLLGTYIRRYGHVLLPIVLIALGIYILTRALPLVR